MSTAQRVGIVVAVIGGLAAIAGVIVGLVPVTDIGQACGSGFAPSGPGGFSLSSDFVDAMCQQRTAPMTATAWTLVIIGVVLLLAGVIAALHRTVTVPLTR